jgi:hypothetical protein
MIQSDIFQAMQEAIDQAEAHSSPEWSRKALDIVRELCRTRSEWNTDDVWSELTKYQYITHEKRALGSVTRQAMKLGWCEDTGTMVHSQRIVCHGRRIPLYHSLLF